VVYLIEQSIEQTTGVVAILENKKRIGNNNGN